MRATPASRSGQPAALPFNVLVVLIDTLRADHLGAYGYPRPTSPNFDALAGDSVVFDRATAQAAWTKPSVASLMTGVYVHKHGVVSNRDALGDAHPTLAEEMRPARLPDGRVLRQPLDHARVPVRPRLRRVRERPRHGRPADPPLQAPAPARSGAGGARRARQSVRLGCSGARAATWAMPSATDYSPTPPSSGSSVGMAIPSFCTSI